MLLLAVLGGALAGATAVGCTAPPGGAGVKDAGSDATGMGSGKPSKKPGQDASVPDADAGDASDATVDVVDASDAGTDVVEVEDAGEGGDAGLPSCAIVDIQPTGAATCGNGWRDPNEECDLGDAASDGGPLSRTGCSTTCQVVDLLDEVRLSDGGLANTPRTLGGGRHPLAASDNTFSVATLETPSSPPTVSLTTFGRKGVAMGASLSVSAGSTVSDFGDPVVAALPCDQYVVAWNDLNGDSDGLGVALRLVTLGTVPAGKPGFANDTTAFDQYAPDVLWTGSQLVVAWTDTSNATPGPDVVLRTFDSTLNPTSDEQSLAATGDIEGEVTLAAFEGSWAAAWKDDSTSADAAGFETIRVHTGSTDWTVGPAFIPPSVGTKIALAELDSTHLLVGYSVGVDPAETGVPNASSQMWAAIVSTAAPGAVSGGIVPVNSSVEAAASGLSHAYANAVVAGGLLYASWWSEAVIGDGNGEQLWFAPVGPSDAGTLVQAGAELLLPRSAAHRVGDQTRPAMAVTRLGVGAELVAAWDDLGKGFGNGEGNGDVVIEVVPVPVVRNGAQ